ncbi:MAG: 50S ribosomal protein L11 methyltransferase [Crocinitomicaceae bacterium]
MKYLELSIDVIPREPWNEIFISDLSEAGFESFQEDEEGCLKAYIQETNYNESHVMNLFNQRKKQIDFTHTIQLLEEQNWNAEWESQFEPVFVDDKLEIIAPFHRSLLKQGLSIVIEPKMTFGTGHHQTTYLICSHLLKSPPKNLVVLDMGTGTGVLAILTELLEARMIKAVEIEEWSVENAMENVQRNNCSRIELLKGSKEQIPAIQFDLILANINKNVLRDQFPSYSTHMKLGGSLLISGFFTTDDEELIQLANKNDFKFQTRNEKDGWSLLQFVKL